MTITLQAVNELIASLESAGELSIKERKYLELAKEFRICSTSLDAVIRTGNALADQNAQLAAENVALKSAVTKQIELRSEIKKAGRPPHADFWVQSICEAEDMVSKALNGTTATDRIVAGIKAEAKSHDLNAFISHYSAELDNHIANGGDQFDERAVRLRGVIVGARMFREKLRDEEKALALREEAKTEQTILDMCCGSRMFWFDKQDPRALFADIRSEQHTLCDGRSMVISPDLVADFRALPFADASFPIVVFDPPHLERVGDNAWMGKKYGRLNKDTWRDDLRAGFKEAFRVLRPHGVLIFKWNETQIPVSQILALTDEKPAIWQRTGKADKTHWVIFVKGADK